MSEPKHDFQHHPAEALKELRAELAELREHPDSVSEERLKELEAEIREASRALLPDADGSSAPSTDHQITVDSDSSSQRLMRYLAVLVFLAISGAAMYMWLQVLENRRKAQEPLPRFQPSSPMIQGESRVDQQIGTKLSSAAVPQNTHVASKTSRHKRAQGAVPYKGSAGETPAAPHAKYGSGSPAAPLRKMPTPPMLTAEQRAKKAFIEKKIAEELPAELARDNPAAFAAEFKRRMPKWEAEFDAQKTTSSKSSGTRQAPAP